MASDELKMLKPAKELELLENVNENDDFFDDMYDKSNKKKSIKLYVSIFTAFLSHLNRLLRDTMARCIRCHFLAREDFFFPAREMRQCGCGIWK